MGFLYSQLFVQPDFPTTDFTDQVVIVTGANIGLGLEAARHFVRLNAAKVILAVRNVSAGEAAVHDIESSQKRPGVCEAWELDLSSFASVRAFAKRADLELPRLDVLLENAGLAPAKFKLVEGHEQHITVNVISTFLLAFLLLPKMKYTAKEFATHPHLTVVTSEVHGWTKFTERDEPDIFAALADETKSTPKMGERYPLSKLLEVLVVREVAPRIRDTGVIINMTNPGLCHSALSRDGPFVLAIMKFLLARSTEVGSRTHLAAASAGPESQGAYLSDGVVDNEGLSPFVRSEEGKKAGAKVYAELGQILEQVAPGVMGNL